MTSVLSSYIGLSLSVLASLAWFRALTRVAIPDNRWPFLVSWAAAILLGAVGVVLPGGGPVSTLAGALAVLGGGVMLTLYALGRQRDGGAIAVGDTIPAFSAPDECGRLFDSADLAGTLVLIKFFRGHW